MWSDRTNIALGEKNISKEKIRFCCLYVNSARYCPNLKAKEQIPFEF